MKDQELEVKFYVRELDGIEERLQSLGARLAQGRQHEVNLRFDTPGGELSNALRVLRLRREDPAGAEDDQEPCYHLTYKGPSQYEQGVRARTEIEFEVSNFEAAKALLEALGYRVALMYEKYRTTYELQGVHITLDEMPYGMFVEIEGPDPASIRDVQARLGLDWERRVPESYTSLFEKLRLVEGWEFRDLSFDNFAGLEVSLDSLQIYPAD